MNKDRDAVDTATFEDICKINRPEFCMVFVQSLWKSFVPRMLRRHGFQSAIPAQPVMSFKVVQQIPFWPMIGTVDPIGFVLHFRGSNQWLDCTFDKG